MLGIVVGIVLLDQVTKAMVHAWVPLYSSVTVIPGLLDFSYVRNTGVAFGMLNTVDIPFKPALMTAIGLFALIAITIYASRVPPGQRVARLGLAAIIGGAIGNLIDRIASGYVVDFVDVYWGKLALLGLQRRRRRDYGGGLLPDPRHGVPERHMYPKLLELGPISIYSYGLLLVSAYLLGLQVAVARGRARGLDGQRVMDLGIAIIVSALVGAKLLLFVVEFDHFTRNPAELWTLVRSGGVFYGGLLLSVAVAFWYMRRHAMPLWATCDAFAPGIAAGQAVGRLGCLLAGCCYGHPTDVPWGITFTSPLAAANVGTPLDVSLHPTQLYESVAALVILGILLALENRGRPFAGRTFWSYLLLYPAVRFLIEFYRGDPRGTVFDVLSTSQFVSLLLVPLSIVMLVLLARAGGSTPRPATARAGA